MRWKRPTEQQVNNVQSQKNASRDNTVRFTDLFRYATPSEKLMITSGILLSSLLGAAFPFAIFVFRLIVNEFINGGSLDVSTAVYSTSLWFAVIALCAFIVAFAQVALVEISSVRQAERIRLLYLQAIFRQDTAWFDQQAVGTLVTKLSEDTDNIQLSIGLKLSEFVQNISSFVFGLFIALLCGWKLTAVALSMLPFVIIGFGSFGGLTRYFTRKESLAYAKASAIAEEVFRSIRTVYAFAGERKEARRYGSHLEDAAKVGIRQATCFGFAGGFIGFTVYASAALVFWYGVQLLIINEYDAGTVILVFLNVIIGSMFLGGALPNFRYFFAAKISAHHVFEIIERKPPVDKCRGGLKPESFFQQIRFQDVSFAYPTRPDTMVLNKLSVVVEQNQTVAFVGPSGCGKSTIMQLLQRLYDPVEGKITIDGVDLTELDLSWFRGQTGAVQQEPVLFTGTVAENIRFGALDATESEVIEAAKQANAHDFIVKLPEGYQTRINQNATGLSVGQKQRIAIARALVRDPRILILDEATSALDSQSETLVQAAINRACVGRTVIMVAHRLSTVRNADRIVVLDRGRVSEMGTHTELAQAGGLYATLLNAQQHAVSDVSAIANGSNVTSEPNTVSSNLTDPLLTRTDKVNDGDGQATPRSPHDLFGLEKPSVTTQPSRTRRQQRKPSASLRVMRLSRPEWLWIVLGSLGAIVTGAIQPIFAILYSEMYAIFTLKTDPDQMQNRINLTAGIMALLGLIRLASSTFQAYFFGVAGQRLTKRLRLTLFESILRQELAWFDEPDNQVGTLTARLAGDANKVHPICGSAMGQIVESVMLLIFSLVVAFVYNWKLTLVVAVFFPVIAFSSFINIKQLRFGGDSAGETEAVRVAHEAFSAHRTVAGFALEHYFHQQFAHASGQQSQLALRASFRHAVVYALAQSLPICSYAAAFSFGAHLMSQGEIKLIAIFRVFAAISFAAQALGRTSHLGPAMKQAGAAASRIFRIIERSSAMPVNQGVQPNWNLNTVPIHFRHVSFRYPSRPTMPVLRDFSHTICPGETVAFVGHSGCGKTSVLNLLQRFYTIGPCDSNRGIFVGETPLDRLAPCWLRSQIGMVDQEPHLFDITLQKNIAYGDNEREVSMEEVMEAARLAEIHDFIVSLPHGYETLAGPHGCELSGGEKQRIAIARALIRRPHLFLLDEATSALDTQTELRIQSKLNEALRGRTALISAHRLTATSGAETVVVLADGHKLESGKPDELIQLHGAYHALYHAQANEL
ncbi:ATP binding cassette subfamily B MDR TAP [Fasciola hepatica]|uniref:ATP binding cassette subfamily B MDR TAP n=1 Tax=Fasciola hepatica TaxID=6192 RepID=A0A4E0RQP5_FASHE|nr:ATP binding cassette subfamily B MDR TAP [Fasciola hepatica]